MKALTWTAFGVGAALAAGAVAAAMAQTPAPQPALSQKVDYAMTENWLCRPGRQDFCAVDMTATVVAADGKTTRETFTPDPNAPIDCFYVYPTVSRDPGMISDLVPQADQEGRTAKGQFARLGSKCRLYAPMYRQATLAGIGRAPAGSPAATAAPVPAAQRPFDVLEAWKYYLDHDNKGRGVVLIGHSQGSGVLTRLIAQEIDGKPAQKQLISAILMGTSFQVPKGKDVGGTFKAIPLCKTATQIGCVLTWSTYRDTLPPIAGARFGANRPAQGTVSGCTNPANLAGGPAQPKSYWTNPSNNITWNKAAAVDTPFVSTPGLVTVECVETEGANYLRIHVNANPADPRADDVYGDVMTAGKPDQTWGMHLADANLAMGNVLDLVESQGRAWRAANR